MAPRNPSLFSGHFFPKGGVSACHGAVSFWLGALAQEDPQVSVKAVTRLNCWHWHKFLCQGAPGSCSWKDVSIQKDEALWPQRVSGGFSRDVRDVKDLHMNEEKETQFSTFIEKSWHFSSPWS